MNTDLIDMCRSQSTSSLFAVGNDAVVFGLLGTNMKYVKIDDGQIFIITPYFYWNYNKGNNVKIVNFIAYIDYSVPCGCN